MGRDRTAAGAAALNEPDTAQVSGSHQLLRTGSAVRSAGAGADSSTAARGGGVARRSDGAGASDLSGSMERREISSGAAGRAAVRTGRRNDAFKLGNLKEALKKQSLIFSIYDFGPYGNAD